MMAHHLLALGPPGVLLKMGARGAYVATRNVEEQIDAIAVNAIDTAAAGDAFNGAVGLMLGKDPIEGTRFAVAAAVCHS